MKTKLFIILVLCLCSYSVVLAQQENNVRTQANAIKKNSDYIYGEAAGDNEDVCYEMAKEKLLLKVQNFIDNQPDLSSADAVIIDNIQSKTKKLTYERSIQIKVVCVYVHKSDISPLYKSENIVIEKTIEVPKEETDVKEEEVKVVTQQEKEEKIVIESKEEVVESVDELNKENSLLENSTPVVVNVSPIDNNIEKPLIYSQRENEILTAILKMKQYKEIYDYLEKEKTTRYDVRFKLVKEADVNDCFWLIFDSKKNLVAIFDKKYSVIKGINDKTWEYYKNYPKMWIYVYE